MRPSSVARLDNLFAATPLPWGEGGAKRRVRVRGTSVACPHPALRATFSPREKDTATVRSAVLDNSGHGPPPQFALSDCGGVL